MRRNVEFTAADRMQCYYEQNRSREGMQNCCDTFHCKNKSEKPQGRYEQGEKLLMNTTCQN